MPIRWDAVLTRHLARELEREIGGATLRALRLDGAARDLLLLFDDRTLVWRLHPSRGALLVRPPTRPAPSDITHRARVRRVMTPVDERIVRFELLPRRGGPPRDLVVELLGNQWNAVVLEAATGVVRHVLWSRDSGRGHAVGSEYTPPPPQRRAGSEEPLDEERWLALLEPVPPDERKREIVRRIAWSSPLNAGYLLGEGGDAHNLADEDRDRLLLGYARWLDVADGTAPGEPGVITLENGPQPYPFALPAFPFHRTATLLEALERVADRAGGSGTTEAHLLDPQLMRRLEDAAGRAGRKLRLLEREFEELGDENAVRALGDLILARYGDIDPRAETVVLEGFDGAEVTLTLDPGKPPHENADRYYREAARIGRARSRLPALIEQVRGEKEAVDGLLERARMGEADPEEIREALPEQGTDTRGRADETPLPYRTFRSSGGLDIRVGRGARHNDELTFKHSSPGDVWLHARHAAGAHVILRWQGPGNPPARDLEEAATLAALHSRARTSGSVPVDWTFRKYVRKPRGAARGAVVPDRVSTVFVRPDPALEKRLGEPRDGA
jgi:predicted ribosome quality control (RQC) complex YloA/Tae2 family protein